MDRFSFGKTEQYDCLEHELSEGKKYIFKDIQFPAGCTPGTGFIGFEKVNDMYRVCVTPDVRTDIDDPGIQTFFENAEARFVSMEDVSEFFHSFKDLFPQIHEDVHSDVEEESDEHTSNEQTEESDNVIGVEPGTTDNDGNADSQTNHIVQDRTKTRVLKPEELALPLKQKLFGQDPVIEEFANLMALRQLRKSEKPMVTALLGPTGTGKSEFVRSLADVLSEKCGEQCGYIEIAGSELEGEQSIHRFLGAVPGYVGYGQRTLLDSVRSNPFQVIAINEIEKADERILIGLMEALDTGKLGMADNSEPIDLRRCIIMFTSNLPVDMEMLEELDDFDRDETLRDIFTEFCGRPEISGRIGKFLVFAPLTEEARTNIIIKFISEELERYGIKLGHIDEALLSEFLECETKYGARGLRGLVEQVVGYRILKLGNIDGFMNKEVSLSGTLKNIELTTT